MGWDEMGEMIEIENKQYHEKAGRENKPMGKRRWKVLEWTIDGKGNGRGEKR